MKVGADIEVLLKDKSDKYISSIGLIGGSKSDPRKTINGAVQEDNVLAEFNVNPAESSQEFVQNTNLILQDLRDIIKPLDLSIDISTSALFDEDQLRDMKAMMIGCDPDFNAWTMDENIGAGWFEDNLRTCGGHVHVSHEEGWDPFELARVFDLLLGVPSVLVDPDKKRRTLYGKAGSLRIKDTDMGDPYTGLEYRSLSNFWIKNDLRIAWVFDMVRKGVEGFEDFIEVANKEQDRIVNCIDSSDQDAASSIIDQYQLETVYA